MTLFAALLTTGNVHAYTDTAGGSWVGSLDFSGEISTPNPVWQFEVPTETLALAANSVVHIADGTKSGNNTEWQLNELDGHAFLNGRIGIVPNRSSNLQPVISVGEGATPIVVGSPMVCTSIELCNLTLSATGQNGSTGTLTMSIEAGAASSTYYVEDSYVAESATLSRSTTSAPKANDILDELLISEGAPEVQVSTLARDTRDWNNATSAHNRINNTSSVQWASAIVLSQIGSQTLSFPTANIPATWTASLPIEIQMN